jgi:flavin-dependent dehydrogenase
MRTLIDYEDVSDPIPSPGYMIHRPGLDRGLARAAGAKGALVCSGASFKGLDHGEAIISFKGGLKSIRAGIIIAADGADSRVAKILNLPKPDYLGAAQVEVPLKRGLKDTMVFFHKDFRFGYGWLFPKKEVANAGLASDLGGSQSLSHLLDRFLRKLIDLDLILPGVLARGGGVISVSGLKKTLVSGNLILCGDAGGLTHPITGAGILSALDSGRCAAERAFEYLDLGDKDALEYYQDLMREKYGAIYDHALKKRAVMRKQWDHADFQDLIRNTWIGFDGYKRRERV